MSNFGVSKEYFTSLQFLNEVQSIPYFAVYLAIFVLLGGFWTATIATVVALVVSVALQRFVLNPRQPVPKSTAVIITGCSTGIGFDAALTLVAEGLTVFATVRKDADKDKLIKAVPSDAKSRMIPIIMDVNNDDSISTGIAEISKITEDKNLAILSLINNAGYCESGCIESSPLETAKKQFDTNVFGVIKVTNAALPLIRKTATRVAENSNNKLRPSVMFVSSVVGKVSLGGTAFYCASKVRVMFHQPLFNIYCS